MQFLAQYWQRLIDGDKSAVIRSLEMKMISEILQLVDSGYLTMSLKEYMEGARFFFRGLKADSV